MPIPPKEKTRTPVVSLVNTGSLVNRAVRECDQLFEYHWTGSPPDKVSTDCIVVTVCSDKSLSPAAKAIDIRTDGTLSRVLDQGVISGEPGSTLLLPMFGAVPANMVLLVGTGSSLKLSDVLFRNIVQSVFRALVATCAKDCVLYLADVLISKRDQYWSTRQQIVFIEQAAYRCRYKDSISERQLKLRKISFGGCPENGKALTHGRALSSAINTVKHLSDMPPNLCTPTFLGDFAMSLADEFTSITAEVLTDDALEANGMNALLSVGRGSKEASTLAIVKHTHPKAQEQPLVLVGKGVTFDSGGIAIKSRDAMRRMKYDMCGAATVIGVMRAAAILGLPLNIIGIVACAENMPGGGATRPSDVVTSMCGKTIEILNPDAEGRLLLCDAITYAERFNPAIMIDVATLTGASLVTF